VRSAPALRMSCAEQAKLHQNPYENTMIATDKMSLTECIFLYVFLRRDKARLVFRLKVLRFFHGDDYARGQF
jgi:hypothetical protein